MRTIFVGLLMLTACAPDGESQFERGNRQNATARSDELLVVASQSGGEESADDDAKGKGEPTPSPSPSPTPDQNPGQTPTQSEVVPALTIETISTSGNGCPDDSVTFNVAPDKKAFTMLFDSFSILFSPDDGELTTSRSCRVTLDLKTPPGWQVTVLTVDWRGYAELEAGASAVLSTGFAFAKGKSTTLKSTLKGELYDNYDARAAVKLATATWSGCDATKSLTVDLSAKILPKDNGPAILSVDSIDGELTHKAGLAWRRCD